MAEFEDDAALVGFEDDLRFALLMVARGWSHTLLSVLAQCPGGAMFIVWSCGDGAEVNELALELAPESEVVPAIAWPNWFAPARWPPQRFRMHSGSSCRLQYTDG